MHLLVAPEEGCRALFIHERCERGFKGDWYRFAKASGDLSTRLPISRRRPARTTKRSRSSTLLAYLAASPRPIQGSWAFLVSEEAARFSLPMLCLRDCWLHKNHIMKGGLIRMHHFRKLRHVYLPWISFDFGAIKNRALRATMLPNHHRIPDRHTIHRDPVTRPPPPSSTPQRQRKRVHTLTGNAYLYPPILPPCSCTHISPMR